MEQKNSKTRMVSSTGTEGNLTSDIILLRKALYTPSQVNRRPLKWLANQDVQGSQLTQANSPASLRTPYSGSVHRGTSSDMWLSDEQRLKSMFPQLPSLHQLIPQEHGAQVPQSFCLLWAIADDSS